MNNKKCEGVTPMRRLIERFPQVAKVGLLTSWISANFAGIQQHVIHCSNDLFSPVDSVFVSYCVYSDLRQPN